jgi:hypothetical protein
MSPVKQRLLRIAVSHNRSPSLSEEEFHQWATKDHCARAARIHAKYGIKAYGMVSDPRLLYQTLLTCVTFLVLQSQERPDHRQEP